MDSSLIILVRIVTVRISDLFPEISYLLYLIYHSPLLYNWLSPKFGARTVPRAIVKQLKIQIDISGQARVITNRMQKLRKKAKLVPTDEVTIWYEVTPADSDLARIAKEYR